MYKLLIGATVVAHSDLKFDKIQQFHDVRRYQNV